MTSFVIIGGAGKIAKYHFEAIEKVCGGIVGVIDPKFNPKPFEGKVPPRWFNSLEEYTPVDSPEYYVILSPNHLHVEHSAWALKYGDVICEKPLAISTSELAWLKSEESLGQTKVHPIMQMRRHPMLAALHEQFQERPPKEIWIDYVVPSSFMDKRYWQKDDTESGGLVFHIAIHMLDFLVWTFKDYSDIKLIFNHKLEIHGTMRMDSTFIRFLFSTNPSKSPFRRMSFDGHDVDLLYPFSLHTLAYHDIIDGHPLSISDIEPTIKLCEEIRNYEVTS